MVISLIMLLIIHDFLKNLKKQRPIKTPEYGNRKLSNQISSYKALYSSSVRSPQCLACLYQNNGVSSLQKHAYLYLYVFPCFPWIGCEVDFDVVWCILIVSE